MYIFIANIFFIIIMNITYSDLDKGAVSTVRLTLGVGEGVQQHRIICKYCSNLFYQ